MFLGINAFIVTLGTLTAIRGLVLIYTDGRSLQVSDLETVAALKAFEGYIFDMGVPMFVGGSGDAGAGRSQLWQAPTDPAAPYRAGSGRCRACWT